VHGPTTDRPVKNFRINPLIQPVNTLRRHAEFNRSLYQTVAHGEYGVAFLQDSFDLLATFGIIRQ
jgi:hypothetical protein